MNGWFHFPIDGKFYLLDGDRIAALVKKCCYHVHYCIGFTDNAYDFIDLILNKHLAT